MTEAEWLAVDELKKLLPAVVNQSRFRKCKLFSLACCQRFAKFCNDEPVKLAFRIAEKQIENVSVKPTGQATALEQLTFIHREAYRSRPTQLDQRFASNMVSENAAISLISLIHLSRVQAADELTKDAAFAVSDHLGQPRGLPTADGIAKYSAFAVAWAEMLSTDTKDYIHHLGTFRGAEQQVQVGILRDIFGNPFRPVAFDPAWRTSTAVGVARAIYDDRAFDRLPILADALQDAGCEDAAVLAHCRGPGPHVRGCWVVDLVLGKE